MSEVISNINAQSPGTIFALDDEVQLLRGLETAFSNPFGVDKVHVRTFSNPVWFNQELDQQSVIWREHMRRLQGFLDLWREGSVPLLRCALSFMERPAYERALVICVDYDLMRSDYNGLQVLQGARSRRDLASRRVMLTGKDVGRIGLAAFQSGTIHQFVSKGAYGVPQRVIDAVNDEIFYASSTESQAWGSTLTVPQMDWLRANDGLTTQLRTVLGMVEHVVVGEPFGMVGKTAGGALQFAAFDADAFATARRSPSLPLEFTLRSQHRLPSGQPLDLFNVTDPSRDEVVGWKQWLQDAQQRDLNELQ